MGFPVALVTDESTIFGRDLRMTNFAEVSKGRNYFGWGRILILPQGA
jgi:hypothetical protein